MDEYKTLDEMIAAAKASPKKEALMRIRGHLLIVEIRDGRTKFFWGVNEVDSLVAANVLASK